MVPAAFVVLEAFPLTPSGKVDRRALPAPELAATAMRTWRRAPHRGGAGRDLEPRCCARSGWARATTSSHLGGHSLVATRVVSRVRDAFGVELPLRAVFEAPTVEGLAARVDALRREGGAAQAPPLVPVPRDAPLPLSFAQARLWFVDQLQPGSAAYNMPFALRLRGALDAEALERSITEVARRHEALRTRFPSVGGEPVQVIDPAGPVRLHPVDLTHLSAGEREREVLALAQAEAARPFDLAEGPLLRSTLARLGGEDHALLFTLHHVVSDGWSTGILVREVSTLYGAFSRGEPSPLPELPVQYADYAVWQRAWLSGDALDAQLGYWRERLEGAPPLLEIPTDRPRAAAPCDRGGTVAVALPQETARALRALAGREGATLFMTLLAGWQLLLAKYAGQDDVVVGAPVANRGRMETEPLIGFFVNTLALRTDLSGDPTVRGLLARVREGVLQAQAHQDLPFERLVEALGVERALGRTPLFQAVFAFQAAEAGAPRMGSLAVEPLAAGSGAAKFDLTLSLGEGEGEIGGAISYRAELFDAGTVERMAEHLRRLLDAMAADSERRLSELALVSADERARLLEWAGASPDVSVSDACVHELFAAQARPRPARWRWCSATRR
jgi:hypothetical protein